MTVSHGTTEAWKVESGVVSVTQDKPGNSEDATDGMIALQVHGGARCKPGLYHRFRNVAVKELP